VPRKPFWTDHHTRSEKGSDRVRLWEYHRSAVADVLVSPVCATDLSNAEWAILEPLILPEKPGGRPRESPMRVILDGTYTRARYYPRVKLPTT